MLLALIVLSAWPRSTLTPQRRRPSNGTPTPTGCRSWSGAGSGWKRRSWRWNGPHDDSIAGWGASPRPRRGGGRSGPSIRVRLRRGRRHRARPSAGVGVGEGDERSDYHFMQFAFRDECQSHPTRPGTPGQPGTADPARTARREPLGVRLRRLERLVADQLKRVPALERMRGGSTNGNPAPRCWG